jgi:hypothetical protein
MKKYKLRLTESQHSQLKGHLLPGDGCEAVAIALCGRRRDAKNHCLIVHKIVPIPYEECKERTPDRVTWSTQRLVPLLEEAERKDLAVLKIHSHPGGYDRFSGVDDASDSDLFNSMSAWTDSEYPHCSAIMLPGGKMFGRVILPTGEFRALDSALVVGDDIRFWPHESIGRATSQFERNAQLFGAGTMHILQSLAVAVIGCSGTGSPVVEQLARLGVGRLILVDPDKVEVKNLNRILNATREDAVLGRPKVKVLAKAIANMGLGTEVEYVAENLLTKGAVELVATADIVIGCMDGVEGRHVLNRLAAYYSMPYIDIGVKLVADGVGGIDEACAAVHYMRPDGATLLDRKVYNMEQVRAEGLRRTDPKAYREQVKAGYIHGIDEDRPAVISINMQMASCAVNELLSRLHPYRLDSNSESAIIRHSFKQRHVFKIHRPR